MDKIRIIDILKSHILHPQLLAIYAFGSRIQGTAHQDSDLDLAVLVAGYADTFALWELAGNLADMVGYPVDLLDFRAASTVMQYQILTTGERWWALDFQASLYEAIVLIQKADLNTARMDMLQDIKERGTVYGR